MPSRGRQPTTTRRHYENCGLTPSALPCCLPATICAVCRHFFCAGWRPSIPPGTAVHTCAPTALRSVSAHALPRALLVCSHSSRVPACLPFCWRCGETSSPLVSWQRSVFAAPHGKRFCERLPSFLSMSAGGGAMDFCHLRGRRRRSWILASGASRRTPDAAAAEGGAAALVLLRGTLRLLSALQTAYLRGTPLRLRGAALPPMRLASGELTRQRLAAGWFGRPRHISATWFWRGTGGSSTPSGQCSA